MATYRGVVRHVRYWRGAIHSWSTSYTFTGTLSGGFASTDAQALLVADDKMCYGLNATDGGTYACSIYDMTTGGSAITEYTAFDWTTPSAWVKYSGTAWTGVSTPFNSVAEAALQVEWAAGLSSSGKPVKFRKWYHAVPLGSTTGGTADISGSLQTSLAAQAQALVGVFASKGLVLGSPSGRLAGVASALPFYGAHQMPKGRRRVTLTAKSGASLAKSLEDAAAAASLLLP